ncbi:MAG: DegQ family serine endoprotease [Pseudomonadota bacterium]
MFKKPLVTLFALAVILGVLSPSYAQFDFLSASGTKNSSQNGGLPDFVSLVDKLSPAVVNISTTSKIASTPMDEFFGGQLPPHFNDIFRDFFGRSFPNMQGKQGGERTREVKSLGSGFVIDETGYVVTNHHVINKADKIEVNFPDGSSYSAKVIGTDQKTDLALLKIDADKIFPALRWGDSDEKRVGEWVLAIGNPYGLNGTVTKGIISALNRDIAAGPYDNFIQTDAAINRGNSGGPLFDLNGEVIGVNAAIISPTGGSVGVGFAIPSRLAQNVISQLKESGIVERGWIGVNIQPVTQDIADSLGLDDVTGALVGNVSPDSPADEGGLQPGDVIISVENQPIEKVRDLPRIIAETPVDKTVTMQIVRSGKQQNITLKIGRFEDDTVIEAKTTPTGAVEIDEVGISVRNLDPITRNNYNISDKVTGILIEDVNNYRHIGWRSGDVIVELQKQPIKNVNEFMQRFKTLRSKGQNPILFRVNRNGSHHYHAVRFND